MLTNDRGGEVMDAPVMSQQVRKWLVALRSGEHKQCRKKYRDEETGAVCATQLALDANGIDDESFAILGFKRTMKVTQFGEQHVVKWNDTEKLSFAEIADKVEEYYGG
jgi:hypothetical protein